MARAIRLQSVLAMTALLLSSTAWADKHFVANLSGSQEVPPVVSAATGFGRVILSETRDQVRISLDFTGLGSNQTMAHIHGPAGPGANAPVLINIGSSGATSGTFNVTAAVTPAQAADLERGLWYFNVHSVAFPGGEIRGQVLADTPFEAALTGAQEVPPSAGTGLGFGTVSLNAAGDRIAVDLRYAGLASNQTMAHIHGLADPGVNAGVLFNLGAPGGSAGRVGDLFFAVTPAQATALRAGQLYFNVHTTGFPGGEVRGQIYPTPRPTSFLAPMSGSQEVPPNASSGTGLGVVELLPGDTRIRVSVYWTGLANGVTAGHIHAAAPVGSNASVLINLGATGGASGSVANLEFLISPAQLADLRQGRWYFNLHNAAFPGGEIRGQVFPAWPHRAFMAGAQEAPPNAATGLGLGQVLMTPAADQIVSSYLFTGLTTAATVGHIHEGAIGVAGPVRFDVQPPLVTGGGVGHLRFDLAAGQAQLLRDGQFYFNLHSSTFPAGEIRGQLHANDVVYSGRFD